MKNKELKPSIALVGVHSYNKGKRVVERTRAQYRHARVALRHLASSYILREHQLRRLGREQFFSISRFLTSSGLISQLQVTRSDQTGPKTIMK